jgi:hypothetical protein
LQYQVSCSSARLEKTETGTFEGYGNTLVVIGKDDTSGKKVQIATSPRLVEVRVGDEAASFLPSRISSVITTIERHDIMFQVGALTATGGVMLAAFEGLSTSGIKSSFPAFLGACLTVIGILCMIQAVWSRCFVVSIDVGGRTVVALRFRTGFRKIVENEHVEKLRRTLIEHSRS